MSKGWRVVSRDDFEFAREALLATEQRAADERPMRPAGNAMSRSRQMPRGVPNPSPEPADFTRLERRSALTFAATSDGIGPLVLVAWPFAKLPPKGWQDGHIWQASRYVWTPEEQPQTPLLYPSAARVNLMHNGDPWTWQPAPTDRTLSLAVVADAGQAPSDATGTYALVSAVVACEATATALRAAADHGDYGVAAVRRFALEADALDAHAAACLAAIGRTLDWADDVPAESLPAFPVIPAIPRGFVTVQPT